VYLSEPQFIARADNNKLVVFKIIFCYLFKAISPTSPDSWLLDGHRYSGACSNVSLFMPLYKLIFTCYCGVRV